MSAHLTTLSVNIDHIATLRNARGGLLPNPIEGALLAVAQGAAGITAHLREDRRHIKDADIADLKAALTVPFNLEMAATPEMVRIAVATQPYKCTLVPERRAELTTEGGLDVVGQRQGLKAITQQLQQAGIVVSVFITPDAEQVEASAAIGANMIELHTGPYADAITLAQHQHELQRIQQASQQGVVLGLRLNAGHGLATANVAPVAQIPHMEELNIGHSIMARAIMVGLPTAITELLTAMQP
jgi:pyridoxine 5-phosphate synthase